jgi:hypothetical protein
VPIRDELVARTIERLRVALAALREGRERAAGSVRQEIDGLYLAHVGSGANLVRRLGSDDLLDVLRSAGHVDAERAYLLAALLEVDAAALAAGDDDTAALASALRARALDLLLEAALAEVGEGDVDERVERLRRDVARPDRSEATWRRLHAFDVFRGAYARAEDTLFAWLEHAPGDAALAAGSAFYDHLALLDDAALDRGGLPRDEVAEGRAAFSAAARG